MNSDTDRNEPGRPRTPSEEDCCHGSCDPCVFDMYERLLRDYEKRKEQHIKSVPATVNLLHLSQYATFTITGIQETSKDYLLLSLTSNSSSGENGSNGKILLHPGQYVMLRASNIVRPFTPISWTNRTINFLVKICAQGQFSTFLTSSKLGDKMDIRGPYGEFRYSPHSFERLVMFTIGSGIAAVYPIANAILTDEHDETRIHLVAGFPTMAHIPLRKQLQRFSDYWNFKCTLHLSRLHDTDGATSTRIHGISVKVGRLDECSITGLLKDEPADRTLILVCGTRQFNQSAEQWIKAKGYQHLYAFKSH